MIKPVIAMEKRRFNKKTALNQIEKLMKK